MKTRKKEKKKKKPQEKTVFLYKERGSLPFIIGKDLKTLFLQKRERRWVSLQIGSGRKCLWYGIGEMIEAGRFSIKTQIIRRREFLLL